MKILYFSLVDWDYIRQRPHHLTERLSAYHNLIFVQPMGLRGIRPSDIRRAFNRVSWFFKKGKKGLQIKSPLFIPLKNPFIRRINIHLLRSQLTSLIDDESVLWVTFPSHLLWRLLEGLRYRALIYEMMDDYTKIYPPSSAVEAGQVEPWLIKRADLIIASSSALAEKSKATDRDKPVVVIGNGVDYDFFNMASSKMPIELKGLKHSCRSRAPSPSPLPAGERVRVRGFSEQKIVGYIGTIDRWIDFEAIDSLAEKRPDLNLVFIGPIKIKDIPRRKNIHYTGRVDYERIPSLCRYFDVCLIPFRPGELADTVNPLKLYEYFALGKPVVSYRMKELEPYADLLYLAEGQGDFLEKVIMALDEENADLIAKRKEVARLNDWSIKAKILQDILSELPPSPSPPLSPKGED
jgi:glycosyltransferase involved in cell wall biosynthesis